MGKLAHEWNLPFETEEDVVEFIFEHLETKDFDDSYHDIGGHGEPCEMVRESAEDKKTALYDFMMSLCEEKRI